MDQLYSATLLVALLAAVLGALAGAIVLAAAARGHGAPSYVIATAGLGAALGIGAGLVSLLVHLRTGHGPGSEAPLRLPEFVALHPAYLAVLAAAGVALAGRATARRAPTIGGERSRREE